MREAIDSPGEVETEYIAHKHLRKNRVVPALAPREWRHQRRQYEAESYFEYIEVPATYLL